MRASLRDLQRITSDHRNDELVRVDKNLPRSGKDEQRENLAQLVEDLGTVRRVRPQVEEWARRQAVVEEVQDVERYEVAKGDLADRLASLTDLFEGLGIDVGSTPSVDELERKYPAVSDLVDRHIRDIDNMGPGPAQRFAEQVQARGAVAISSDEDVVVAVGREIRDSLPELRALQNHVSLLKATADAGVDPADWDEKHCRILDDLDRVHGPTVPLPDQPDSRPSLPFDVEYRLREWGLLSTDGSE